MGLLRIIAEWRARRHWGRVKDEDLSGTNHAITRLQHPELGPLIVACVCGEVFWTHRRFKSELVREADFRDREAWLRAFRAQLGFKHVKDVTPAKAKKVRGIKKPKSGGAWF